MKRHRFQNIPKYHSILSPPLCQPEWTFDEWDSTQVQWALEPGSIKYMSSISISLSEWGWRLEIKCTLVESKVGFSRKSTRVWQNIWGHHLHHSPPCSSSFPSGSIWRRPERLRASSILPPVSLLSHAALPNFQEYSYCRIRRVPHSVLLQLEYWSLKSTTTTKKYCLIYC